MDWFVSVWTLTITPYFNFCILSLIRAPIRRRHPLIETCIIHDESIMQQSSPTQCIVQLPVQWSASGGRRLCCCCCCCRLCNQSSGSILPGPCRTHLPWRCCTAGSRQSGRQRRSPQHGLVQPGRKQTGLVWVTDLDQGGNEAAVMCVVSLNRLDHISIISHSLL